ncbi:Predicted DNA-binding transcriptional regulator YafY, contains an HTH and WYL domains [Lishizhenia tianjinensis]|uniref:Predicted DNA-binding transcriptional regulator YafY, contains an HTH and WYL domains n=1 Tax=Lishizhenia tianjinensis TaxID=477690 RepID=A0A1I7ADC7_9FLAO|nr:WYL domain-containing protein [Lishizhenia tianjinensis]SFT72941.1 Predicted DNA-binding transcriptional regulator YafY, contains an HTH and WYL domains [Lishizhenia tianjinensis]
MPHIKNALIRYRIIDKCLRNKYKPFPSKQDLRQACEEALYGDSTGENICDSTIEKDMFAMRMEHDAPIKYSKRDKGYYYTEDDFTINEIPLSEDDVQAIKFAANTLVQFRDVDMFKQFGSALDKIFDRVNISNNPNDKELDNYVQFETVTEFKGSDFLSPLLKAIKEQKVVYFDYESFVSGKKKRRKVTPLLLKEYRNRWYLIAFDLVKDSIITYGLDRMMDLELSEEMGKQPANFNAELFFKHSVGITANENSPEQIKFKANNVAAKYIASQPFHASQKIVKEGKKRTSFEMEVLISEELIRQLVSYAFEIEVVKPLWLRDELAMRFQQSVELYNN